MTPHNIYHFSFPIYSQQTLDVAAVCGDAGQFLPIDIFTGIGQLHKFSNFSYEKKFYLFLVDVFSLFHIDFFSRKNN